MLRLNRRADCKAVVTFLSTEEGGRGGPTFSGYCPSHAVRDDYLTSGEHDYLNVEQVLPGEAAVTMITFITPEVYPKTLYVGRVIRVQEASRLVGYAEIVEVFNHVLDRDA